MLQTKKDTPYIGVFKTQSGEEFIAKVVEETMIALTVKMPLCMIPTEQGMRFAPFLMMADPERTLTIPKPIISGTPAPKLEEQYEQATTSIALPRKM